MLANTSRGYRKAIAAFFTLLVALFLSPAMAMAQQCLNAVSPGECDLNPGTAGADICLPSAGGYVCDLAYVANTDAAEAYIVRNGSYWEVFGTEGNGDDFCCMIPVSSINSIDLWGTQNDDVLSAIYDDGTYYEMEPGSYNMSVVIYGMAGSDTITGSNWNGSPTCYDVLYGEWVGAGVGSVDYIDGNDGNDVINGGPGADEINGGDDHDTIYGDAGADIIDAGAGTDVVYGGLQGDTIYGGSGPDELHGDDHDDTIYGGTEADTIYGGIGVDYLWGGSGNDIINGNGGNDYLYGEEDDDTLCGGQGNDLLYAGPDDDILWAGITTDDFTNTWDIEDGVSGYDACGKETPPGYAIRSNCDTYTAVPAACQN